MTEDTVIDFDINIRRMMQALDTSDHIGALLRVHYELDRSLEHVIQMTYPNPSAVKQNFTGQKLAALSALGVHAKRLKPATIINSLRNSFAHRGREEITTEDVTGLLNAVNVILAQPITDDFTIARHSKANSTVTEKTFSAMTAKEKFCILGFISIALIAALSPAAPSSGHNVASA